MASRITHRLSTWIGTTSSENKQVLRYFDSWWMFAAVVTVMFLVFIVGSALIPAIGIIFSIYAGYRTNKKQVPSQALGAGFVYLAILFFFHLQLVSFLAALLIRFSLYRYAFWRHPQRAFRRPIGNSDGYYYNPAKLGLGGRISIWVMTAPFPFVGRFIARRLLIWIVGLEIEASELPENDIAYYLHEESPGYIFENQQSEEKVSN